MESYSMQLRLVEEVRKRPKLWMKKSRRLAKKLWNEISQVLETDVATCKGTWQMLRMRFWAEKARIVERIEKAKEKFSYDSDFKYTKWPFFDPLKFLENKRFSNGKNQLPYTDSDDGNAERQAPYRKKPKTENFVQAPKKTQKKIAKTLPNDRPNSSPISPFDNFGEESDNTLKSENDSKGLLTSTITIDERQPLELESENDGKDLLTSTIIKEEPQLVELKNENGKSTILTNTFIKEECEIDAIQIPGVNTDINGLEVIKPATLLATEISHGTENGNVVGISNQKENHQATALEEHTQKSVIASDQDYSFLYSFLSQIQQMSELQKIEFDESMKTLLCQVFPAAASVDNSEFLLQLDKKEGDLEKKFLISFWPFMKSMTASENVLFRAKMSILVCNVLSTKRDLNFDLFKLD